MTPEPAGQDVLGLLDAASHGDAVAAERLFPIVYDELHRIAAAYMRRERPDHTLQATALVHEAFVRLVGTGSHASRYEDLRHFVATAAVAMRRILVNHAKARAAEKRGGGAPVLALDEVAAEFNDRSISLIALDESLERLANLDARQARLVELRFFGGMSVEDCATTLGVSARTVHYEWAHARAWLRGQLESAQHMDRDRWQKGKDLFTLALDQPASERAAFVERQCGDAAIREEVLRLLRLDEDATDFLVSPVSQEHAATEGGADPLIGRDLGGFKLLRRIGVGGMGAVYEAQQEQPRRRAAVKVLRPGIFAARLQRRFEYESEVLAKLHHPGIAQVFAAGVFDVGGDARPWFAMELIDGPNIQTYVKNSAMTLRGRLELLLSVCDAVQHAHQCGIVHRDLKPDNILVTTTESGAPRPKVLDFGVARSIDTDVHATMHTVAGELVGTLAYMSPEQLSGDSERIDARCDVYALGVITYEVLSGRAPHGDGGGSIAKVIRAIEHEEPARLGTGDPSLRGDVEVIVAKALEKDASRRYQSAAELAADLRRFLNDEPVLARPATAIYQFRKFARRNRALVGGVVATMLALAAGMILYAREAQTARRAADEARYEADKATAINNYITNDFLMKLLAAANSPDAQRRLPVPELVEKAADQVGVMFAGEPLSEAAVRNEIGTIHYNLGAVDQAGVQFERALQLWEAQLGPDHVDTLKAVNNLGQVRARQRRGPEAEALYRRALDGRRKALGDDNSYTLVTMNNLAEIFRGTGRLEEAEALLRQTLASQLRVHGEAHKNTITTLGNLGSLVAQRGRNDEALDLHRRAHSASRATLGGDHIMTAMTGVRLGTALQQAGRPAEAAPILVAVAESAERTLGAASSEAITARRGLAEVYRQQGKSAEAADQLKRAIAGIRERPRPSKKLIQTLQKELDELQGNATPAGREGQLSNLPKSGSPSP